jgi:hypothetical protein
VNRVAKCLVVQLVRDDDHRTRTRGDKRSRHASEQGTRKHTTGTRSDDEQIGFPALGQRREALDRPSELDDTFCPQSIRGIGHLRQQPQARCDRLTPLQLAQAPIAVGKDGRVGGNVHEYELAAEPGRKRSGKLGSGNGIGAVDADDDWTSHFEPPVEWTNRRRADAPPTSGQACISGTLDQGSTRPRRIA